MARTVKIRPDQPLFKADAFHMPLWVHAPFEVARGLCKWLAVTLESDNPHRNVMENATFLRAAKKPHRLAFWSGRSVVKGPKWRVMAWRWALVFTVLSMVKYLPLEGWKWLGSRLKDALVAVGHGLIWSWQHWAWLPVILSAFVLTVWLVRVGSRFLSARWQSRSTDSDVMPWFEIVLYVRDRVVEWVVGRGGRA